MISIVKKSNKVLFESNLKLPLNSILDKKPKIIIAKHDTLTYDYIKSYSNKIYTTNPIQI